MKMDYKKGMFVMDYLQGIGLDMITVARALDDKNSKKSYKIIVENPGIGKYDFIKKLGIDYDEELINLRDFLGRLLLHPYHIAEALADNYDKTLEVFKSRPDISREEFLEFMQFTGKYKEELSFDIED